MEIMLAPDFVKTEVKELLKKYKMTIYDEEILIALATQIIKSYEDYKKLVSKK